MLEVLPVCINVLLSLRNCPLFSLHLWFSLFPLKYVSNSLFWADRESRKAAMTLSERNIFKKASEAGHLKYKSRMIFFWGEWIMPHFLMPISRTFTPTFDLLVNSAFALFKFFLAYLGMHLDKQAYLGLSSFCFGYLFCIMFSISPYYARSAYCLQKSGSHGYLQIFWVWY